MPEIKTKKARWGLVSPRLADRRLRIADVDALSQQTSKHDDSARSPAL